MLSCEFHKATPLGINDAVADRDVPPIPHCHRDNPEPKALVHNEAAGVVIEPIQFFKLFECSFGNRAFVSVQSLHAQEHTLVRVQLEFLSVGFCDRYQPI